MAESSSLATISLPTNKPFEIPSIQQPALYVGGEFIYEDISYTHYSIILTSSDLPLYNNPTYPFPFLSY